MLNSTSRRALRLLSSLELGRNALLFYDNDKTMERFLFDYVKTGLQRGENVLYFAGIRSVKEAEKKMSSYGIDCDYYKRNAMLQFTTYDEMFLVGGRLDLSNCHKKLFNMTNGTAGGKMRLATESNWWLLSDVFENALDMEATHDMLPRVMSVVCSYNIADLMKYVSIYHLARLMELHNDTILETKGSTMLSVEFYSYLGKCILDVLEEDFDYIAIVRKKHSRFISEMLTELQMRIGSDMPELERNVEEKLGHKLRLN